MKTVAIKMIKANKPVFFGSDVGQFSNTSLGVMDTDLYDYELGFNLSLGLTKAERIRVGSSAMTHAMVLTAVDLDDAGNPLKWRVENSWGTDAGQDGYFLMSDRWFDEYVYQVVCHFSDAPKELVDVFKGGKPIVLPAWDPMVYPYIVCAYRRVRLRAMMGRVRTGVLLVNVRGRELDFDDYVCVCSSSSFS